MTNDDGTIIKFDLAGMIREAYEAGSYADFIGEGYTLTRGSDGQVLKPETVDDVLARLIKRAIDTGRFDQSDDALSSDDDQVNHPSHYNQVPDLECIDVVRHFNFNRGNAIKYVWRAGAKGDEVQDLQKAIWYLTDEIARLQASP